ncbi:uridine kinase [Backusella circina FSU 941]|nr:uridine kinase [Backusella circina FSU 941]
MRNKQNLQLCTQGRRAWYSADGTVDNPYIIGIGGGSASGKTSVAEQIVKKLNIPWVVILSMDSFYNILTLEQSKLAHQSKFDFDHPTAFDMDLAFEILTKLKEGKSVNVPIYDFASHSRQSKSISIYGANIIIFEGIFALFEERIRELMDIFVDTDPDIQLTRRIRRDIKFRGRDVDSILDQYIRFVKPSFDNYIRPTMKFADIIIPRGVENTVAIDIMTQHIQNQLDEKIKNMRLDLVKTPITESVPKTVHRLPFTNQVQIIHTILRDKNTERDNFVFHVDRLSILLMDYVATLLPTTEIEVTTRTNSIYKGTKITENLCGVFILRGGGTMEPGLTKVFREAMIGKLLIQTNPKTGDSELYYCKLPKAIKENNVILADATIGTGASALMAIRILLDHEVPEERIIFVCILAAQVGLAVLTKAFPRITIVTSGVDPELNKRKLWIEPGMGNFGDRYFGTEEE